MRSLSTLWNLRLSAFLLAALISLPTSGRTQSKTEGKPGETGAAVRGKVVYNRACAYCHGSRGDGKGPASGPLNPRPRDFTRGTYKFRSTPSGELPTDEDLYRTITNGIPKTMMPAWGQLLSRQERLDVVVYIKSFSDKFERFGAGESIVIGQPTKRNAETMLEGLSLYMLMECWACHGVKGKGDGKSSNTLVDDWGHKIKPFNFTHGVYKGGADPKSVYRTFSTGLNGTPMPAYAEAFLFGGDSIDDLSLYRESFKEMEVAVLKSYLNTQPSESELGEKTQEELDELINGRRWSLVHYVKSLSSKPGLFTRLFGIDTEETK